MSAMLIAAALFLAFLALPCAVVTWRLFKRQKRPDFDRQPELLDAPAYAPWKDALLADIAWMRRQDGQTAVITAWDGTRLSAEWYDTGAPRTVIMVHGYNATPLNNFAPIARAFREAGWNLLMPWQRAHGPSGGRATTLGHREARDLRDWIGWLSANAPGGDIVLYGMSMGGAAVAYAAGEPLDSRVKAMVLDCCFCLPYGGMLVNDQRRRAPWRLMLPLVRFYAALCLGIDIRRDAREALRRTQLPALFISGGADATISPEAVRDAYECCAAEKRLLTVPGATHTLAFLAGGDGARAEALAFAERYTNET